MLWRSANSGLLLLRHDSRMRPTVRPTVVPFSTMCAMTAWPTLFRTGPWMSFSSSLCSLLFTLTGKGRRKGKAGVESSPVSRGSQNQQSKHDNPRIYYLVNSVMFNMQPFKCSFSCLYTFKKGTGQILHQQAFCRCRNEVSIFWRDTYLLKVTALQGNYRCGAA